MNISVGKSLTDNDIKWTRTLCAGSLFGMGSDKASRTVIKKNPCK